MQGSLDKALECFRQSLGAAKLREERMRALNFLVVTALEMNGTEAALGYANELVAYDPVRELSGCVVVRSLIDCFVCCFIWLFLFYFIVASISIVFALLPPYILFVSLL